jgi:RNA polymerase sigma-70 factor (ECF subfamily)
MNEDWERLELARAGDETAWRVLFQRHYGPLVKMTSCITGLVDPARDIVQECFVRLLHCRIKHRDGSLRSFLSTMAYRLALKEKGRRNTNRSIDKMDLIDDAPSPLEEAIRKENDRRIVRVIQSLPDHHREIVALRFFGGHSYEEIAAITGIPVGTVKSRIFHAVKSCKEKLQERGISL